MSGLPSYDGLGAPEEIRADAPEGIGAPPHGGWRGYYLTAYGIAVKHGFRGSEEEWLKTLGGERGERAELRFNGENKCLEYMYASEGEWRTLCELRDIQGDMVTAVLEEARGYALTAEEHEKGAERHEAASERYTAEAESWAHGETGVRKGEDEDNGKYYARVAAARAADAEDSAVRAETAAETAAEDASRRAVENAAELLSGYVSDAETARSGAESAEAAARSSAEQAAVSAEAARSSAEASENSAKNSAESEDAADAARRSAEAARDAAEAAGEKAQLERLDAELAREGAEAAAKDSAAARDAAAASAEASERAAVRAEEIIGQDLATKDYVADAVSAHDASPEAHADIRAELEKKADEESVASRLAGKAGKDELEAAKSAAETALSEHNASGEAHEDIRTELKAAKTAAETALSAHNVSGEAHGDIRDELAGKADDAETKSALAGKVDVEAYEAAMKNKADLVGGKVKAEQLPEMNYDDKGTADAVDAKLSAHTENVENPHKVTAAQVHARPDTWTPTAADVHARADTWMPSAADVGAVPVERTVNGHALSADVTLGAGDVNAVPVTRTVNGHALSADVTLGASDVNAVPVTRKVNGHALSADVTLGAGDVNAVPTTRKVNGHALSEDVTLGAGDVNAVPTTRKVNGKALAADVTIGAGDIAFEDGETFQQKLDSGELRGQDGKPGADGTGGTPGRDGVSPTVKVSKADGVTTIEITDASGKQTATINDGAPGKDGAAGAPGKDGAAGAPGANGTNGKDGVSPTVATSAVSGGTKVTITDAVGAHEFTVKDGAKGANGTNGKDGVSPTVATSAVSGGTKVTITDAVGAHEFTVKDGAKGADGTNGTNGKDGAPGATGPAGPNTVSTTTTTNITGLLKGNGSTVAQAAAGTDYLTPSGADGKYLMLAGGTMTGQIAMGNHKVSGVAAPTADSDAATKKYVDDKLGTAGLTYYCLGLTAGNNNTNYISVNKAGTSDGSKSKITLTLAQSGTATGIYANARTYCCPVMLLSKAAGGTVSAEEYGYNITYLYNGQLKIKQITKDGDRTIETLGKNEVLTVLAVY